MVKYKGGQCLLDSFVDTESEYMYYIRSKGLPGCIANFWPKIVFLLFINIPSAMVINLEQQI